jgi:hypothetical protein
MAEAVSPAAGRRYGIAHARRVRGLPRTSFHAVRAAKARDPAVRSPQSRRMRVRPPRCFRYSGIDAGSTIDADGGRRIPPDA